MSVELSIGLEATVSDRTPEKKRKRRDSDLGLSPRKRDHFEDLKMEGVQFFTIKEFEKAAVCLQAAHNIAPGCLKTLYDLGLCYKKLGQPEKALQIFQMCVQVNYKDEKSLRAISNIYLTHFNDLKKGEETLRKIIRINGRCFKSWSNLGHIYFLENKFDVAKECFKTSLKMNRKMPLIWLNLAKSYFKLGHFDKSWVASIEAREIDPENVHVWEHLGFTYRKLGDQEAAIACFSRCLSIDPNHKIAN